MRGAIVRYVGSLLFLGALFAPAFCDDDLSAILQKANASLANRDYEDCLSNYVIVLTAYEQQNNQRGIADISYKIGYANRRLARFEEGDRYLTRALKIHHELGEKEAEGVDLTELAVSRERVGSYDEALKLSEQALALNEETGNKDVLARTLENFANIYYRKGEYSKSLEYFNRAIPIGVEGGNKETLMNLWQNVGQVYSAQNEYDEALACYDKSRKLANEIGDPRLLGIINGNEALLYWTLGDLEKARDDFERNLSSFQQSGFKQHLANTFYNLGSVQMELGDYGKAQQALLKAYELSGELKDRGLAAVALNLLGRLQSDLGNYDVAEDYIQRSSKISEETGERRAVIGSFVYLGQIYEKQGRLDASLEFYRKALKVSQEDGDKSLIATALERIGDIYAAKGDHIQELENQNAALALREAVHVRADIGSSYLRIGSAYYSQKNMKEADLALAKSVEILEEVGTPGLLWQSLYKRALVFRDTGKSADSIRLMKQAVETIENLRNSVELPEQRSSYLEDKVNIYEDLVQLLIETKDIGGAFEFAERSKARAFLDLLSEERINPDRSLNSGQYNKKKLLLAKLVDLSGKIQEESQKDPLDKNTLRGFKEKQSRLNGDYLRLMVEIREENPRYEQLQRPEPLNVRQAQSLADSKSAIVEYFVGKKTSTLFLITSSQVRVFKLPGEEKLNGQVYDLLQAIQKPDPALEVSEGSFTRYRKLAALIYQEVLGPAERLLHGKTRIILIPDGPLNYLPFESLLTAHSPAAQDFSALPYLALQYQIQYAPSVSVLSALQDKNRMPRARGRDLIAFGDPVVPGSRKEGGSATDAAFREWSAYLPDLPYARAEVQAISALYPAKQVTIFMNKDASESNVKKAVLDDYRILHFASHGLIDEDQPQFSALVLNPGDALEDGFLTMREVFDLKLNADLVVLSACKTGLGKQIRGEGLAGLSRAFFTAGASNVLVSLWNVYDQSTADFMTSFYTGLRKHGLSKAAALQDARLQMIHSPKFSHPYYWAPFILIGAN